MPYFHYTDKELEKLLSSLVILCDTREKENRHITDAFDRKKIKSLPYTMSFGDYSVMLPASVELGILRDVYFDKDIIIERKGSLEELSGNLTHGRERFIDEMIRARDAKKFLLIEGATDIDIINHNYKTKYNSVTFMKALANLQ